MRKLILFTALLFTAVSVHAQGFGATTAAMDGVLFAGEGNNQTTPGKVYTFSRDADGAWVETGSLRSGKDAEDGFGLSISADGDVVVVGAPLEEAAYVYTRQEDGSFSDGVQLSGFGERFGAAVAVRGDQIIVGATGGGSEEAPGMAHVFTKADDGSWSMTGHLGSESVALQQGGVQVAIDGDLALVAAPMAEETAGRVIVFKRAEDGSWSEVQQLAMPVSASAQMFGTSLYLHHGHAMIGAPGYEARTGAVAVFHLNEETGVFDYTLRLSPAAASGNEFFGVSQVHDPDHNVWIGAPGANGRMGAVYSFDPSNMMRNFSSTGVVEIEGLKFRSGVGAALAAGPDFVAVGAPGYDGQEGGAFVFDSTEEGPVQSAVVFHDNGAMESFTGEMIECEDGQAAGYGCEGMDVQSFLSIRDIGGVRGTRMNDIWGWTDEASGREFALVGRTDGSAFVEITDPYNPVFVGNLAMTEGATASSWRDIKVFKDHAFIVSDRSGPHGMQVFDLSRLLDVENAPVEFDADVMYTDIASAHNIVINEETGYAYSVASKMGGITCGGGLHMIDINDPVNPTFAGCFSHAGTGRNGTGNTHDAQCVVYRGPDTEHAGKEICLGSNEVALSIADVTDKANPAVISRATYPSIAYTHQGWLTEDHRYFYINDEADEPQGLVEGTRTLIFDVQDLDDPILVDEHIAQETSTDHNLYIKGNLMYQSNYVSGLRVLDVSDPEAPVEVAYFDTVPDDRTGGGSWSNFPWFESGTIPVTSIREGLFMIKKREVDI